ncbi:MAG: type II toxin-antitoxin system VapB family antitoxin [Defluviicoccus sp.]
MAISLKDAETDRLARALAGLTGESLTEAVRLALAERLEREQQRRGRKGDLVARLDGIARHCAGLPDRDRRTAEDIVGYDQHGLPR